jgi:ABC-type branched-subunit amino acid transport system substrate-binding protein
MMLVMVAVPALSGADELTAGQARGQRIYEDGTSASGAEITAVLGNGQTEISAALLPCVNCHGEDGRGREEGGRTAADITWHVLTKPYLLDSVGGRSRPPYEREAHLVRAITMGLDAGGNRLDNIMPRFRMSRADMQDLIAYLKLVGSQDQPGVTPDEIRIGVVLPPVHGFGSLGAAMQELLQRSFAAINQTGGLYGRRLRLLSLTLPDAPEATSAVLSAFLDKEAPFALVATFMAWREDAVAQVLRDEGVPSCGALTLQLPDDASSGGPLFYLMPDLLAEGRALAVFWAENSSGSVTSAAVLHGDGQLWRAAAEAVSQELVKHGVDRVRLVPLASDTDFNVLGRELALDKDDALFLLVPGQAGRRVLAALSAATATPSVLSPGFLAESIFVGPPLRRGGKIYLSWPILLSDQNRDALADLRRLAPQNNVHSRQLVHVAAAAAVLVEGLRRAGRNLSRRRLIASLEGLYDFPTGLMRPVSFGANRRLGSAGAHVVSVDTETGATLSEHWVELD